MVIPDIGEKIAQLKAEIERIISTDPYQYKFLLGDEVMVQEKKEEIRQSIDEMNAYSKLLEGVLNELLGEE